MKNVLKLFLMSDLSAEIWAAIEPPIPDYFYYQVFKFYVAELIGKSNQLHIFSRKVSN